MYGAGPWGLLDLASRFFFSFLFFRFRGCGFALNCLSCYVYSLIAMMTHRASSDGLGFAWCEHWLAPNAYRKRGLRRDDVGNSKIH